MFIRKNWDLKLFIHNQNFRILLSQTLDYYQIDIRSYAISELIKKRTNLGKKPNLSFFRDSKGFEVDTIADWNHTFAIEIKSTSESEQKLSANTKKYLSLRQDENCKGIILYLGDLTCSINDIKYVAWQDWSKFE